MRRGILLALTLCCVALTESHGVKLIHPKSRIVMGSMSGRSLPFQAHVQRHPDNRWVQLEVWQDGERIQSSGWSIDGEEAAAIQPTFRPLVVHVGTGKYTFRALACSSVTDDSECGKVRASAVQEISVCGGESCQRKSLEP